MTWKHFHYVNLAAWSLLILFYYLTPAPHRISGDDPDIWPILAPRELGKVSGVSVSTAANQCLSMVSTSNGAIGMPVVVPCLSTTGATYSVITTTGAGGGGGTR
jgi:hypothetical protein